MEDKLVLEVTYFKGGPPAIQHISQSGAKMSGPWFALFQKIPGWKPRAGEFSVQAVSIVSRFEDEKLIKVRVSVFTGEKFHDNEVSVAEFQIQENERKTVTELKTFGVEPFEIAVVRKAATVAMLPTAANNTESIQVMIEPNYSVFSNFKVKLLNNSNKSVSAFAFQTKNGDRLMLSGMPQSSGEKPLIASGEVFETLVRNNLPETNNSLERNQNLTFILSAVVFEDETFEGDVKEAARFLGFSLGRKIFLRKAVPTWQSSLSNKSEISALGKLREQISALSEEIDEAGFLDLSKRFPNFGEKEKSDLRMSTLTAVRGIKRAMLAEIDDFSQNSNQDPELVANWLRETAKKYQDWLTALSKKG